MQVYEVDLENGKITVQGEIKEPGQGRVKLEFTCAGYKVGCALDPDQFIALVMALHGASGELMTGEGAALAHPPHTVLNLKGFGGRA